MPQLMTPPRSTVKPVTEIFRGAPVTDRYRWFEFGTVEDADDFAFLAKYSPYAQVRDGVAYPATMIAFGDADRNFNPLNAYKMTARLQAANASGHQVFLDYRKFVDTRRCCLLANESEVQLPSEREGASLCHFLSWKRI